MSVLWAYVRRHLTWLCALFLCALIFAMVVGLYKLPMEAVGYAAILCLFVCGVFFTVGFLRYRARHKALLSLESVIAFDREQLPEPRELIERDYQALIRSLGREMDEALLRACAEKTDMLDYYTLWAHQIKTPIAAMRLILREADDERGRELLSQLFRTEQYADMVLAYLRIGSDSSDYVLRECDLQAIVRAAVRKYAALFIHKKIALALSPISLIVVTDEKWLAFVIEQLLSNALKYTREGGRICLCADGDDLLVEDNGIGIAPEDLPRVFEKGFTGYNGRTDLRASGIGLYLSKRILTRMGHDISITSKIGEGTRVRISFRQEKRLFE